MTHRIDPRIVFNVNKYDRYRLPLVPKCIVSHPLSDRIHVVSLSIDELLEIEKEYWRKLTIARKMRAKFLVNRKKQKELIEYSHTKNLPAGA